MIETPPASPPPEKEEGELSPSEDELQLQFVEDPEQIEQELEKVLMPTKAVKRTSTSSPPIDIPSPPKSPTVIPNGPPANPTTTHTIQELANKEEDKMETQEGK